MFFNDDVKIGDTSTSTTFDVDSVMDPNAGQYGWTKADRGHYNQLIGYVNDSKKYYDDTATIGEYVKQASQELIRIEGLILYINSESAQVEILADQIDKDAKQATIHHSEVDKMYRAIQLLVNEIRTKYDEIVIIGAAADQDAEDAKQDATLAADYYLRTKAMYDEWKATQP